MRTHHQNEINTCKLGIYRALRHARNLRRHQDRWDWRTCVAIQLAEASRLTRHAIRLRQEERRMVERDIAAQLAAALAAPLEPWEELIQTAAS